MNIFGGYRGLLVYRINVALGAGEIHDQRVTIEADEEPPQTLEDERDGLWWRAELVKWDEGNAVYMVEER